MNLQTPSAFARGFLTAYMQGMQIKEDRRRFDQQMQRQEQNDLRDEQYRQQTLILQKDRITQDKALFDRQGKWHEAEVINNAYNRGVTRSLQEENLELKRQGNTLEKRRLDIYDRNSAMDNQINLAKAMASGEKTTLSTAQLGSLGEIAKAVNTGQVTWEQLPARIADTIGPNYTLGQETEAWEALKQAGIKDSPATSGTWGMNRSSRFDISPETAAKYRNLTKEYANLNKTYGTGNDDNNIASAIDSFQASMSAIRDMPDAFLPNANPFVPGSADRIRSDMLANQVTELNAMITGIQDELPGLRTKQNQAITKQKRELEKRGKKITPQVSERFLNRGPYP
ncbi:MAG: hypothetical protein LLF76_02705 [Planctomycetaceae bacterium]|nr:hypothetical protein [Planctomycetaceae bacterium]